MITNYNTFLENKRLSYYSFDWDDNILHMPTIIHMDKLCEGVWQPVSISPSKFAEVRNDPNYRSRDDNPYKAYEEFRDIGPRGEKSFIEDIEFAIVNNNLGPSWKKFIKCLTEGSLFAIVTARAHEYKTLKEGVKYVIDNCLTFREQNKMYENCLNFSNLFDGKVDYVRTNGKFSDNKLIKRYLECCKYYGVGFPYSNSFKEEFPIDNTTTSIEEAKKMVLDNFIEICNEYGNISHNKISIGFSDDDKKNVEHIKKYFEYKSSIYENMRLNVYDTSNKKDSIKTIFELSNSAENKDGSIMRLTGFNTLPNDLGNTTSDFSQPNYTLNQKAKVANKLTRQPKKRFIKRFKKLKND